MVLIIVNVLVVKSMLSLTNEIAINCCSIKRIDYTSMVLIIVNVLEVTSMLSLKIISSSIT